jgi:hypothetical protein
LFFREERQKVLHLDFQNMGKEISARWKQTDSKDRAKYEEQAKVDAKRYRAEVTTYEEEQLRKQRAAAQQQQKKKKQKDATARASAGSPGTLSGGGNNMVGGPSAFPSQEQTQGLHFGAGFSPTTMPSMGSLAGNMTNDLAALASASGSLSWPSALTSSGGLSSIGGGFGIGGGAGNLSDSQLHAQLRELQLRQMLLQEQLRARVGLGGVGMDPLVGAPVPSTFGGMSLDRSILDALGLQNNQQQQQQFLQQQQLVMQIQADREAQYRSLLLAAQKNDARLASGSGRSGGGTTQSDSSNGQVTNDELEEALRRYRR